MSSYVCTMFFLLFTWISIISLPPPLLPPPPSSSPFFPGLATAIGGTLVGMTGGLAAPFIAAGTGAIIGTAGAAVIGSGAGAAIIGSAFGVGGAGLIGFRMKRRVGGLEQFEFEPLFMDRFGCGAGAVGGVGSGGGAIDGVESLHVGIAISGWLNTDADDSFKLPWVNLMLSKEQYALKWEGMSLSLDPRIKECWTSIVDGKESQNTH